MKEKDEHCIRFGEAVRKRRLELRLSQEQLAAVAGIHRTFIGGIERGERNPTVTTIYRIAKALKTEASALFKTDTNN